MLRYHIDHISITNWQSKFSCWNNELAKKHNQTGWLLITHSATHWAAWLALG